MLLGKASAEYEAAEIYGGRSFQDSVRAATESGAKLLIVSAGLGLIEASQKVPSYGCTTLAASPDSVSKKISGELTPGAWWTELSSKSPFSNSLSEICGANDGYILIAMSGSYLNMIAHELLALPAATLSKLRIFTRAQKIHLRKGLRPYVLPYDDRLDGPSSHIAGTRGDFASRALRHFVDSGFAYRSDTSMAAHIEMVERSIKGWQPAPKFDRKKLSDDEIQKLILDHWNDTQGSSTKLLRVLRDELNVACEQSRFANLVKEVRGAIA